MQKVRHTKTGISLTDIKIGTERNLFEIKTNFKAYIRLHAGITLKVRTTATY